MLAHPVHRLAFGLESLIAFIVHLIERKSSLLLETHCGWVLLLWGIWVTIPFFMSIRLPQAQGLFVMSQGEWLPGLVAAAGGLFQLLAVYSSSLRLRKYAAFIACCLWCGISGIFLGSDYRLTATVVYPTFAIANSLSFLRLHGKLHRAG